MAETFTAAWAATWREEINRSGRYRRSGARSDGCTVFVTSAAAGTADAQHVGVHRLRRVRAVEHEPLLILPERILCYQGEQSGAYLREKRDRP